MAKQNRVTPRSDIVAAPARGSLMGNRGCLHEGESVVRPYRGKLWIACALEFRGRRVQQWTPRRYTVLFFHDEAVSLAAGHRPCGECRHDRYTAFKAAWHDAFGAMPSAAEMNERLHEDRLDGRRQRVHTAPWTSLPAGAFAERDGVAMLVDDDRLVPWGGGRADGRGYGYGPPVERPSRGNATVLTPRCTVAVLAAGYQAMIRLPADG